MPNKFLKCFLAIALQVFTITLECAMPIQGGNVYYSVVDAEVDQILSEGARVLAKKFHISPCGSGASMPGNIIKKFNLSFDIVGPASQEYLRKTLILCAENLLAIINSNKKIQPFLIKTPFGFENVQIIFFIRGKNRSDLFDPEIRTAEISLGHLTYRTFDREKKFAMKNEFSEMG